MAPPLDRRSSAERIVCQGLGSVPAWDTVELVTLAIYPRKNSKASSNPFCAIGPSPLCPISPHELPFRHHGCAPARTTSPRARRRRTPPPRPTAVRTPPVARRGGGAPPG